MTVNNVFCEIKGCKNTAHCRIQGVTLCSPCIDSMAVMNSDNEQFFRAELAVAQPLEDGTWKCKVCDIEWDSFHIRNGVCLDCRSVMPLVGTD